MRILALEPYHGGSHRAFLDDWSAHSRHDWTVLGLPPFKWKWRMRHSAYTLAEQVRERLAAGERWDALFCSDMLDLAAFYGLAPAELREIPSVTYFICGLEDDTVETVARNLAFLHSQPTVSGISLFYGIPGLSGLGPDDLFENISPRCCAGSSAYPWCRSLSTETLVTAFRLSRLVNLLKETSRDESEERLVRRILKERRLYTLERAPHGERRLVPKQASFF